MRRKKCQPSAFPSYLKASGDHGPTQDNKSIAASASEVVLMELMEENKQLRRERVELELQISHFKTMEMKLLECLSHHTLTHPTPTPTHHYAYL
ncbi:UNVERIFIED_CONTAM: hypothetical protein Sradi_2203100 [Sesamum radiatum]|uniref:Uncharacterized protein n=1 Tax=Sesamum radiatum TaxID=300843 RepID=A0AAW2T369_SESRA